MRRDRHAGTRQFGVAAAIACVGIVAIGLSMSVLVVNFVLAARGASGITIGLITAVGGLATIVVSPAAPALARRLGTVPAIVGAIAVMAASFFALYWTEPLWLWFLLRFVYGVGLAAFLVVSEFWINDLVPRGRRGLILGIYAAAQSLGFAAGPALVAGIGSSGLTPFAAGAGLLLAAAIPVAIGARTVPKLVAPARRPIGAFLRSLPIAMLAALTFGAVEAGMNLLPVYGLQVGHAEAVAALLATAVAVGNVALQVPIGFAADKVDRRKLLLGCGATALAGTILMPAVATGPVPFMALLVVWGGVVAGLYSVGLAHLGAHYEGAELAAANAAFVMVYSIGRTAGPAIAGAGLDLWNPHGFALALALMLALFVALAAYQIAMPKLRRARERRLEAQR